MAYSPVLHIGIRMQAHGAEHLAAGLIHSREGDGAGVVDLDQAGDEGVGEIPHGREEAQPQILRRDLREEGLEQRLVLGPHRADQHLASIAGCERRLPFLRIGTDRETQMA